MCFGATALESRETLARNIRVGQKVILDAINSKSGVSQRQSVKCNDVQSHFDVSITPDFNLIQEDCEILNPLLVSEYRLPY